MKKLLVFILASTLLMACEKQTKCDGCDLLLVDPGDEGGGGSGGGVSSVCNYSGYSNCDEGSYTFTHDNMYRYTINFTIVGDVLSFNISHTFLTQPHLTGQFVGRNVYYDALAKEIRISSTYIHTYKEFISYDANHQAQYNYYNTTINTYDVIKVCENKATVS